MTEFVNFESYTDGIIQTSVHSGTSLKIKMLWGEIGTLHSMLKLKYSAITILLFPVLIYYYK